MLIRNNSIDYIDVDTYMSTNEKVREYLQKTANNLSNNNLFPFEHRLRSSSGNDSISSSTSDQTNSPTDSHRSSEEFDFDLAFDYNEGEPTILNNHDSDVNMKQVDYYLTRCSMSTLYNMDNLLNDSTNTLCTLENFSEISNEDDEQFKIQQTHSISLNASPVNDKLAYLQVPLKKVVRFADMHGLELESIRFMTPPDQALTLSLQESVRHQLSHLYIGKDALPKGRSRTTSFTSSGKQYNLVSKHFQPPANIIPIIYDKRVLLECLYTKDSTAYGTVRVHNCSYEKYVFIRVSHDEWITSNDIQAWHSMSYPYDNTDTFTFEITLGKINDDTIGPRRILFAICLQAMSTEFWDNNQGWNYALDVTEKR